MRRIVLVVLATTAACVSGRWGRQSASPPVSDVDYSRVSQQNPGVEEARQQVAAARDELGRAKLHLMNDRHEGELARSDQAAAVAEQAHADAEGKIGRDSLEPGQMERARADVTSAALRKEVADAHARYAAALASSREAAVAGAESKVSLLDEKVNAAKLQAMDDTGVPAAAKYEHAATLERVAQAQQRYDRARSRASDAELKAAAAREEWEALHRQAGAPASR